MKAPCSGEFVTFKGRMLTAAFNREGRKKGSGKFANPRMLIAKKRDEVVLAAQSGKRSCRCRRACECVPAGDGCDGLIKRPCLFSCRCVERLAASAMHAANGMMVAKVCSLPDEGHRHQLGALLVIKTHARQTKLSWLREPPSRARRATVARDRQQDRHRSLDT
jgi:hypothetical protein